MIDDHAPLTPGSHALLRLFGREEDPDLYAALVAIEAAAATRSREELIDHVALSLYGDAEPAWDEASEETRDLCREDARGVLGIRRTRG